jgi:uncharacterized membrane protein
LLLLTGSTTIRRFNPAAPLMRPTESPLPVSSSQIDCGQGRTREIRRPDTPEEICIELCAHNSLSRVQARWFLATVAVGPALTAGFCLFAGFWPVLPFAGLEFGLLWLALHWSMRRGKQRESIAITPNYVTISSQLGVRQANTRFARHWTKVKLRAPQSVLHPTRLCLESQGRACEVGGFLTDDERRALAARLQQLIGNMNDSPAL